MDPTTPTQKPPWQPSLPDIEPVSPKEARKELAYRFGLSLDNPRLISFCRRDILIVPYGPERQKQAFYRSTGADKDHRWVPFDAIVPVSYKHPAIFDTSRYRCLNNPALDRFGTAELKELGSLLDAASLPPSEEVVYQVRKVNEFINTSESRQANVLFDRYDLLSRNRMAPTADEYIADRERKRTEKALASRGVLTAEQLPDGVRDFRSVPGRDMSRPGQLKNFS